MKENMKEDIIAEYELNYDDEFNNHLFELMFDTWYVNPWYFIFFGMFIGFFSSLLIIFLLELL